jgi:cytochrome c-type biogenesis protein CcmH/NrfF
MSQALIALDKPLEARYKTLAEELRCLVCQNQTLADSHADLAMDLKQQVREQLKAGQTDAQIRAYMVQRYGDFVLYKPPVQSNTALLWAGPFVLLGVGALIGWRVQRAGKLRQSQAQASPVQAPLPAQAQRLSEARAKLKD